MKRACRPSSTAPLKITRSSRAEVGIPRAGFSDFRPFSTAIGLSAPPGVSASERRARPFDGRVDLVRDHQPQPGGPDLAGGPQEIPLPPAFDQLAFAEKLPVLDEQPALDGGGALVDEDELLDPDFFLVEKEMEIGVGGGVLGLGSGPDAAHPEQLVQCAADVGGPSGNGVDRLFYVLALDHGEVKGSRAQGVQGSREEARPGTFFSLERSTPCILEALSAAGCHSHQ